VLTQIIIPFPERIDPGVLYLKAWSLNSMVCLITALFPPDG